MSKTTGDGAGAQIAAVKPGLGPKMDASVEMTFPGSDPISETPEAGLRAETEALHEPIACSMAVRRMVTAGLQAAYAGEGAMLARLPGAASPFAGMRAEGERQLERLQRALSAFGVSPNRGEADAAPEDPPPGPVGELALAVALRVEGSRALGLYEALEQVASATDLTDVAQYMQEGAAAKRRALDALARLCGEKLIGDAVRAGGDPLPDPVLHRVFGA